MMLTLNDGRSELWQWDTGRTLAVEADCSQVHFSNKVFGRSIDVDVADGTAIIPDVLLQTDKDLNVWAFVGTAENGYTKISKTFKVNRRNKPADYVFTPVEQMTIAEIAAIAQSVRDDADNGLFDGAQGPAGPIGPAGPQGEQGLTGPKGDTGPQGEQGPQGLQGVQGEKGEKGEKGDKGDTGDIGPQGPQGAPGANGKDAVVDSTLTQIGQAADAKAVGDKFRELSEEKANQADVDELNGDLGELNNLITSNIITSISTIKGNVSYDRLTGRLNVNVDETTGEAKFFIDFDKNGLEKVYTHIDGFSNVQKTNPIFSYAWTNGGDNISTGNIYIDGIYEVDLSRFTGTRRYFLAVGENINCTLFITVKNDDIKANRFCELSKDIENNKNSLSLFDDSFSVKRLTPNIIKNGILYPSGLFVGTSTHNTLVYHVSPNSKVYIKAKKTDFNGALYGTYQFQRVSNVSTVNTDNVVGETVTGDVNSTVTVPGGAYYLLVSVKVNDNESGMYSQPINSQMEKVFRFSNTVIMPCFDDNLKLNIMVSNNHGKSFETYQLNVFEDENGGTIRDPSIVRYNGQYVIAYSRHGTATGNTFGLCVSDDLIHWYSKPNVTIDGMSYVWAPELFVDNGTLYCIVGLSSTKTSDLSLYLLSTTDLINWTTPVVMDFDKNSTDTCHDGFIIKAEGKYNLFYKDSTYPPSSIVLAQSDTINGHYTIIDSNIRSAIKDTNDNYGTSGYYEGASVIELPNGKFRMFVDNYAREKYYYLDSSDLVTWSMKEEISRDNKIRHGTAYNFQ